MATYPGAWHMLVVSCGRFDEPDRNLCAGYSWFSEPVNMVSSPVALDPSPRASKVG